MPNNSDSSAEPTVDDLIRVLMRALDARLGDGVEVIYEAKLPDDWFGVWGGGPADA